MQAAQLAMQVCTSWMGRLTCLPFWWTHTSLCGRLTSLPIWCTQSCQEGVVHLLGGQATCQSGAQCKLKEKNLADEILKRTFHSWAPRLKIENESCQKKFCPDIVHQLSGKAWCTPAWHTGSPACQAGVHNHGRLAQLLSKLIYTSMAEKWECLLGWCAPAWSPSCCLVARLTFFPSWFALAWCVGSPTCWPGVQCLDKS